MDRLGRSAAIVTFLLAACAACSGDGGGGGGGDAGTATRAVTGTLVDEDGVPLARTQVLGCMAHTCLYTGTDAVGRFSFAIEPPARVAVKTIANLSVQPRRGAT